MSEIDYKKLRKEQKEALKKGSFPFPTYAEALFSQVLVTRSPITSVWEIGKDKGPKEALLVPGPMVASQGASLDKATVTEIDEMPHKTGLLKSLGQFVSDNDKGEGLGFQGGQIKQKDAPALEINTKSLVSGALPRFVEEMTSQVKVIFIGECPRDFDSESPEADLLSKMIKAMKLQEGQFLRCFITKEQDIAEQEWFGLLKNLPKNIDELVVVTLGALSTNTILKKRERLSRIHGKEFEVTVKREDSSELNITIFPVFHPDILQINPNMKRSAWIDLQKVMEFLG